MKYVNVLVEGYTEDGFVRAVLQPYLWNKGVHLEPTIFTTKRVAGGKDFKGGGISYGEFKKQTQNLLRDGKAVLITTMIDFHKLTGFPGLDSMNGTPYDKVQYVEQATEADIQHERFKMYLSLHEFEALLFADPAFVAKKLFIKDKDAESWMKARQSVESPEEINRERPPSYYIKGVIRSYQKDTDGVRIIKEMNLDHIRGQCPHFDAWLTHIEGLAET